MKEDGLYPLIDGVSHLPLYADFTLASKIDVDVLRDMAQRLGDSKQLVSCRFDWDDTFKERLTTAREGGLTFCVLGSRIISPETPNFIMRGVNAYFGNKPQNNYRDLNPVNETRQNFEASLSGSCENIQQNTDHNPSIVEECANITLPALDAVAELWPKSIVHCEINGQGNEYNAMDKLAFHTDAYSSDMKQIEERKMRDEWGYRKGFYINLAVNGDGMPVEDPMTKEISQCSSYTWNMFTTHGHSQGPLSHSTPVVRENQSARRTLALLKVYPTLEEWSWTLG